MGDREVKAIAIVFEEKQYKLIDTRQVLPLHLKGLKCN